MEDRLVFCIVGPSGVGKTTVTRRITESVDSLHEVVSITTREKRDNEVDGRDYHFVSEDEVEDFDLIERVEYNGNIYGLRKKDFEDPMEEGKDLVVVVERHGLDQIENEYGDHVKSLLMVPPDLDTLEKRLRDDGREESKIKDRLETAEDEINKNQDRFGAVIENDDLGSCVKQCLVFIGQCRIEYNYEGK